MAYTIQVRVHQMTPEWYSIVEKTVFTKGTWTESAGTHTLKMDGSGTSSTLRFHSEGGEYFIVAMGVHNYKPWTDIVPNLTHVDSGVSIHPTYYSDGEGGRSDRLWAQAAATEKTTSKRKKLSINVTGQERKLFADIYIVSV